MSEESINKDQVDAAEKDKMGRDAADL